MRSATHVIDYQRIYERCFVGVDRFLASDFLPVNRHQFSAVIETGEQKELSASRVLLLADIGSGEMQNPWDLVENSGCLPNGERLLDALLWEALPAIKWLRFYAHTIDKTRKRHIRVISEAVAQLTPIREKDIDTIDTYISNIWFGDCRRYYSGDRSEYQLLLGAIRPRFRPTVRSCALRLLIGSRAQRPNESELSRLERDLAVWN